LGVFGATRKIVLCISFFIILLGTIIPNIVAQTSEGPSKASELNTNQAMQGLLVLVLSSFLALLFGVWLILQRHEGALSLQWLIGVFAVVFGLLHIFAILKTRFIAP
jgi:hypothetical protein